MSTTLAFIVRLHLLLKEYLHPEYWTTTCVQIHSKVVTFFGVELTLQWYTRTQFHVMSKRERKQERGCGELNWQTAK